MIRIVVSRQALLTIISNHNGTWLSRAEETRAFNKKAGYFKRASPSWGEIKQVYIQLQHSKCAYCERQLSRNEEGPNEWDIEHFRPKRLVAEWSPIDVVDEALSTADLNCYDRGYHLLSHHPLNYVVACKPCNSILKKNYFPIAGVRDFAGGDPSDLIRNELPYLIYPLSDVDADPETLITFNGVVPVPVAKSGHDRLRACVTIDVFRLAARRTLDDERAMVITTLWLALETLRRGMSGEATRLAKQVIDAMTSKSKRHTNCARAFESLYSKDIDRAAQIGKLAGEIYSRDPGS